MEGASFSKFALDADFSAVRFDSQPAKGQTDAGRMSMLAAALCLSKFFKDMFVLIRGNTRAVVRHRDSRLFRIALHSYPDCSIRLGEFNRITDQILQNPAKYIGGTINQNR